MIRPLAMIIVLGVVALTPCSWATQVSFIEVSQPFFAPDGGPILQMHRVTYAAFIGSSRPGMEIQYLVRPNCIVQEDGTADSASQDRNVASMLGVRVTIEDRSGSAHWKKFGTRPDPGHPGRRIAAFGVDTLTVDVDLARSAQLLAEQRGKTDLGSMVSIETLAKLLAACIRDNASRSDPLIRHVRIRFTGAVEAQHISGVYQVAMP